MFGRELDFHWAEQEALSIELLFLRQVQSISDSLPKWVKTHWHCRILSMPHASSCKIQLLGSGPGQTPRCRWITNNKKIVKFKKQRINFSSLSTKYFFIDQLVLSMLCGQYNTSCLYFPHVLVLNLDWVNRLLRV